MPRRPFGAAARTALASTAGLVLLVCLAVVPAAAQSDPVAGATPSIQLVGRSPWVAADASFDLDLDLAGPLDAATVQIVIREPLSSVEDLERSLDEDVGGALYRSPDIGVGLIPVLPDGARRITIATSVGPTTALNARLRDPGVYPVDVRLEVDGSLVETVRTPLVRLGTDDAPLPAPSLEIVADVAVAPRVEPLGRRPLSDDELDRLSRLGNLMSGTAPSLADSPPVGLTVAALPDTLDALAASTDARAAAVVDSISSGGDDRVLVGLPTVPLSASALVDVDLDGVLGALVLAGRAALDDRFDLDVDATLWDGRHGIDRASGEVLADLDVEHVMLDAPGAVEDSPALERTLVDRGPVAVNALDALDVVLVDGDTTAELLARAADRVDAGHIALAQLLIRDDGAESTVLIRIDDAEEDSLLLRTLPLLVAEGSPVAVGPLDLDPPDAPNVDEPDLDEPDLDEPDLDEPVELPEADVDLSAIASRVREATTAVGTFSSLVTSESARTDELALRIATSIAVGVDSDRRDALLDAVGEQVADVLGAVSLAGQTDLNLTSRSGTLPLIVRNDNDFPVEVVLQIRSERLGFPDGDRFTIAATEEITRVDVPVRARATGSVPTFVEMYTPDGRILLDSRQLNVRSTAISGVGLAISLAALAVLVFWWARTWRRSRRDPEKPAAEPAESPET